MKLSSGYETKKARVEMLPLIDVVFLLLVFFIYAMVSMVVHRGLRVDLPATGTAVMEKNDYISITIDANNALYLNSEPVDAEELARLTAPDQLVGRAPTQVKSYLADVVRPLLDSRKDIPDSDDPIKV